MRYVAVVKGHEWFDPMFIDRVWAGFFWTGSQARLQGIVLGEGLQVG
jgi:hypothetical protein